MTGLHRLATNAPMYRTARTRARPPQTVRLPRRVPLSRLKGATPTRAAVQRAQLRQVGQEGERELLSNAGDGAQEVVLLPPHWTLAQSLPQPLVQVVQLPLKPCNVSLNAGTDGDGGGGAQAVLLRD